MLELPPDDATHTVPAPLLLLFPPAAADIAVAYWEPPIIERCELMADYILSDVYIIWDIS